MSLATTFLFVLTHAISAWLSFVLFRHRIGKGFLNKRQVILGITKFFDNLTARHHRHNHVQNYLIIFGKSFLQTDKDNGLVNFA